MPTLSVGRLTRVSQVSDPLATKPEVPVSKSLLKTICPCAGGSPTSSATVKIKDGILMRIIFCGGA
jgi:hypothetical protein